VSVADSHSRQQQERQGWTIGVRSSRPARRGDGINGKDAAPPIAEEDKGGVRAMPQKWTIPLSVGGMTAQGGPLLVASMRVLE
jgi:hypothetical protein